MGACVLDMDSSYGGRYLACVRQFVDAGVGVYVCGW